MRSQPFQDFVGKFLHQRNMTTVSAQRAMKPFLAVEQGVMMILNARVSHIGKTIRAAIFTQVPFALKNVKKSPEAMLASYRKFHRKTISILAAL